MLASQQNNVKTYEYLCMMIMLMSVVNRTASALMNIHVFVAYRAAA